MKRTNSRSNSSTKSRNSRMIKNNTRKASISKQDISISNPNPNPFVEYIQRDRTVKTGSKYNNDPYEESRQGDEENLVTVVTNESSKSSKKSKSSKNSTQNEDKKNTKINVDEIDEIKGFPEEFVEFAKENKLKPPTISTGNGKALSAMLNNPYKYWDRESSDKFAKKFNITTRDSIQLFNKHEQWGIKTSNERGKNYIVYPYQVSNKHKMRKDFKFDGTDEEKNIEIDKIKSTIKHDYVDVANKEWQLGHKNPESDDNKATNLVLQPPIQAKYRDNYIFLDTLTKIPTPSTLIKLYNSGNSPYTNDQLKKMKEWLNQLDL